MYYYYCEKTGESTWSYPIVATPSQTDVPLAPAAYGTTYPGAENTGTPSAPTAAPLDDYGYGRSNMMMWRSDLCKCFDLLRVSCYVLRVSCYVLRVSYFINLIRMLYVDMVIMDVWIWYTRLVGSSISMVTDGERVKPLMLVMVPL